MILIKIVEIIWADAFGGLQQITEEELYKTKPLMVHSVGYLLKKTKDYTYLGFSLYDEWDSVKHYQAIPNGMIKKYKVIANSKN